MSAKTPEQLMRSRFTAYKLSGYGDYLYSTWYQAKERGLTPSSLNKSSNDWQMLEIINKHQTGNNGIVEFKAYYRSSSEQEKVLHERSKFIREDNKWYYVDGDILQH